MGYNSCPNSLWPSCISFKIDNFVHYQKGKKYYKITLKSLRVLVIWVIMEEFSIAQVNVHISLEKQRFFMKIGIIIKSLKNFIKRIKLFFYNKCRNFINNKYKNTNQNYQQMKKVLAVLTVNPQYVQFAVPQLKALLSKLKIPFSTLFSESMPLPQKNYQITHKVLKNFPYITLTVPNFQQHREYFQIASKKAVMVSKFVLLISQGQNYQELFAKKDQQILNEQCRDWNQQVVCDFISRNRVIGRQEQNKKIHQMLEKFDVRGKVNIKNATQRLQLIQQHKWYQNHHQVSSEQTLQRVYFGIQLSSFKLGTAKFNIKYQLGNRIYLGPTSTDNDLAFLMCNQANIQDGSYVFDPFVGTAGLLIPPASNGAMVFGCDLDMRVLNGYSVGRINKRSNYYSVDKQFQTYTPKINLNFEQYDLPRPNIIRMDCTKCTFAPHTQFDAIITDPPYGLRAMSRSMKKKQNKVQIVEQAIKQQNVKPSEEEKHEQKEIEQSAETITQKQPNQVKQQKTEEQQKLQSWKKQKKQKKKQTRQKRFDMMSQEQKKFKNQVVEKLNRQRIDNWDKFDKGVIQNTQRQVIFQGLLSVARRHLKVGGRLVFLYPIFEEEEFNGIETLPTHEGFQVIDMSENILSRNNSRILVTLQKK